MYICEREMCEYDANKYSIRVFVRVNIIDKFKHSYLSWFFDILTLNGKSISNVRTYLFLQNFLDIYSLS